MATDPIKELLASAMSWDPRTAEASIGRDAAGRLTTGSTPADWPNLPPFPNSGPLGSEWGAAWSFNWDGSIRR